MNNVFTKSTVLLALLAILLGGGITSCKDDGDSGEAQPEYVGKIYSAKDGKSYLKIDTKDTATYCVWEEGSEVQASARAAETGRYVQKSGRYTVEIVDGKETFSLKITDDDGNELSIIADLTQESALVNFKVNGKSVEFVRLSAVPTNPDKVDELVIDDSSDDSSDSDDVTVLEGGFVKIPAKSIKGTETWTPESKVFINGRKIEIQAFYMCDHPVTRAEYKAIIGSDPSRSEAYNKEGNKLSEDAVGNNPVNSVCWYDAIVYCNKLSIKENLTPCYTIKDSIDPENWDYVPRGNDDIWDAVVCDFSADGYRLPTEAEWEWAARGGKSYIYAGSDNIDEVAWYKENINDIGTRDVKSKKANGYRLYDMSGNVCEWCWDWRESYSTISKDTDKTGPSYGTKRCQRGGCYMDVAALLEISYRSSISPYSRDWVYGFRVVRTAK